MRTVADLVIGSDGYCAVFLDRERALQWAARCGGLLDDLVSRCEAEAEMRESYRRGLVEGQALANTAPCLPSACESQPVGQKSPL